MQYVAAVCERLGVPYRVVGSMASSLHGEPRATNDIDMVLQLDAPRVAAFCSAFPPPDFYCSLDAARDAVNNRFQFKILHLASGLKVDVILASDSEFDRAQLARGGPLYIDEARQVCVASPEDVIVKKLEYFQLGGSEKHLRDVVGILKVQGEGVDREYLARWIGRLDLEAEWRLIEQRLGERAG